MAANSVNIRNNHPDTTMQNVSNCYYKYLSVNDLSLKIRMNSDFKWFDNSPADSTE
jgi:hypothetical protein